MAIHWDFFSDLDGQVASTNLQMLMMSGPDIDQVVSMGRGLCVPRSWVQMS